MAEDLGKLIERLASQGERVIIIGQGEPMVILPLNEYEKLKQFNPSLFNERVAERSTPQLESIDPLSSPLPDDDQYFPEPL
ncbi:MAG: hypothetical protein ABIJ81_00175 [Patescibacteria group bacterium]